jgi:hypothetical protein
LKGRYIPAKMVQNRKELFGKNHARRIVQMLG